MSRREGKRPRQASTRSDAAPSLKAFPSQIRFKNALHEKRFEQLHSRQVVPNSYVDEEALRHVGLWEEVQSYITKLGWDEWVLQKFPSYEVLIYEFLSLFEFNNETNTMSFRLGNENFEMSIWEIKRALKMPIMYHQFPTFDKNSFWG